MIIHADLMLNGILRIKKYDDRIVLTNLGLLKLPIYQIYQGGESKARNQRMQNMFRMIGFGENLGSGFPKILDAWKEAKWKTPLLEDRQTPEEVRLTLPIPFYEASENNENGIEDVLEKLTDRQRIIYKILKTNVRDNVRDDVNETTETLARKLSVSSRTIRRDLDKMKSLGIVKREGGDYGGKWVVITS